MRKLIGNFLFSVFLIQYLNAQIIESKFVTNSGNMSHKVMNFHQLEQNIKTGDIMQCEIFEVENYDDKNDTYVFTDNDPQTPGWYVFQPISPNSKCYSFQLRASTGVHLAFSNSPTVSGDVVEVVIISNQALIRKRQSIPSFQNVKEIPAQNFLSANEFRGFWVRWTDDYLIEVGHDHSSEPFISYRNPAKLSINFAAYLTWMTKGAWIIHGEPKCPGNKVSHQKRIKTNSNCRIMSNIDKITKLQKAFQIILSKMKTQHNLYKALASMTRPRGYLIRIQQEIDKYFKEANEITNEISISVEDNVNDVDHKLSTFNEISALFHNFTQELQNDLEESASKNYPVDVRFHSKSTFL